MGWLKAHPFVAGFAGAVVGVLVALGCWHLYQDHRALHEVIGFLNRTIEAQQKAKQ